MGESCLEPFQDAQDCLLLTLADAADGELSREALLMARAAGQIDRAPVAGQIDGVLIHEGPGGRITFVA